VTEQGLADLRGLSPKRRARLIIDNCAHPIFSRRYRNIRAGAEIFVRGQHTPHILDEAFTFLPNWQANREAREPGVRTVLCRPMHGSEESACPPSLARPLNPAMLGALRRAERDDAIQDRQAEPDCARYDCNDGRSRFSRSADLLRRMG